MQSTALLGDYWDMERQPSILRILEGEEFREIKIFFHSFHTLDRSFNIVMDTQIPKPPNMDSARKTRNPHSQPVETLHIQPLEMNVAAVSKDQPTIWDRPNLIMKRIKELDEKVYEGLLARNERLSYENIFLVFEEARDLIRLLKVEGHLDWAKSCNEGKIPYNIPHDPSLVYKYSGWEGWDDFWGQENHTQTIR
jgi:hypothetical protein